MSPDLLAFTPPLFLGYQPLDFLLYGRKRAPACMRIGIRLQILAGTTWIDRSPCSVRAPLGLWSEHVARRVARRHRSRLRAVACPSVFPLRTLAQAGFGKAK